jgi:hypothetical protein
MAARVSTGSISDMKLLVLLFLFFAFSLASIITGNTVYSNISMVHDKQLTGYNYSSVDAVSPLYCVSICSMDNKCLSFNFKKKPAGKRKLNCQLNRATKRTARLTDAKDFIYGDGLNTSTTREKQVRQTTLEKRVSQP